MDQVVADYINLSMEQKMNFAQMLAYGPTISGKNRADNSENLRTGAAAKAAQTASRYKTAMEGRGPMTTLDVAKGVGSSRVATHAWLNSHPELVDRAGVRSNGFTNPHVLWRWKV